MSTPFSILDIARRINSLSVAYGELDDDDTADETGEAAPPSVQSAEYRVRHADKPE
jgi:hypothetical protein